MRRDQIIQILQFILAWVIIFCFVVFVMEDSFVGFVLKYWLFFLIASVSYFYYYSLEYETDKKYKLIRNILLYGNVYLVAHIFFRPLLNISHQLFVLLGLIILGIWWTTKLRTRWRYLLQMFGGFFSFFILISGLFYLYPDAPDIEGFMESRMYQIFVSGLAESVAKNDAYLRFSTTKKTEDIQISPYFNKMISEDCVITYPSVSAKRTEKIFFMTPEGDLLFLYPQSEIQIQFSGNKLTSISTIEGKVGFFSGMFHGYSKYQIIGDSVIVMRDDDVIQEKGNYQSDLVRYLKNQISDSNIGLADSTIMYNIDAVALKFLSKMFPTSFSRNLKNYEKFQYYFSLVGSSEMKMSRYSTQNHVGGSSKNLRKIIIDNMKIGRLSTRFL